MKNFQYQIIRYVHDQFTGEYVNLGVVVFAYNDIFLKAITTTKYSRVTAMFPTANGAFVSKTLRHFANGIKSLPKDVDGLFKKPYKDLDSITASILPKDDSAIKLREVIISRKSFFIPKLRDVRKHR